MGLLGLLRKLKRTEAVRTAPGLGPIPILSAWSVAETTRETNIFCDSMSSVRRNRNVKFTPCLRGWRWRRRLAFLSSAWTTLARRPY